MHINITAWLVLQKQACLWTSTGNTLWATNASDLAAFKITAKSYKYASTGINMLAKAVVSWELLLSQQEQWIPWGYTVK